MRLSIGTRLALALLGMICLSSGIAWVALRPLSEVAAVSRELSHRDIPELRVLWEIRNLLTALQADAQRAGLSRREGEPQLRLPERALEIRASMARYRNLQRLHPAPVAEEEARLLDELVARGTFLDEATDRVLAALAQPRHSETQPLVDEVWEGHYTAMLESVERLLRYEADETLRLAALAETTSRSGRKRTIALSAVAIAGSIALAIAITLSLTRPIRKLVRVTERVAGGDRTSRAAITRKDELGLLANRFDEMLDRLDESFEAQQSLIADVSHELRTPLTIMRGEAEVALRVANADPERCREALQTVVAASYQMGRLIDDLLFLARAEAGHLRYDPAPVELAALLNDIVHQAKSLSDRQGLRLRAETRGPATVWGDAEQLRQLFLALLDNAIKYSKPGGEVTIALATAEGRARVQIADSGIGIPPNELPHVFERFFRGKDAVGLHPGAGSGAGLGLCMARSIVDAHRGTIAVESERGVGAAFAVSLPSLAARGA